MYSVTTELYVHVPTLSSFKITTTTTFSRNMAVDKDEVGLL